MLVQVTLACKINLIILRMERYYEFSIIMITFEASWLLHLPLDPDVLVPVLAAVTVLCSLVRHSTLTNSASNVQSNGRSNPEVVGSIPTEVKRIFLYLVWFPDSL